MYFGNLSSILPISIALEYGAIVSPLPSFAKTTSLGVAFISYFISENLCNVF